MALEALRTYLDGFRGWADGPLFQTLDGRRLPAGHLNILFTRLSLKCGVAHLNPHRFRHTFATWAIRASARELDVQYLLMPHKFSNGKALLGHLRLGAGSCGTCSFQPCQPANRRFARTHQFACLNNSVNRWSATASLG